MNKNAVKKFAIAARTRLINMASDKAGMLGITKDQISTAKGRGQGFEIYLTSAGTENTLNQNQINQRRHLVSEIESRGFDVVMEEVAYTWFNRICAIRFMEVNDYLPTRIRVLSSLKEGKNEPDLVTEAPDVDLNFTDNEREWILTAKEQNRLDDLFSMLFIKQCNKLSEILPELFEATEDYTEMLLSLSYTNADDVVRMLVDGVAEDDFSVITPDENGNPTGQVEIIGWLYQYYNTELKDDTFAKLKKNVKITKERIPAATQLFTPDWIVRYMVENSVGRIWIEHLRAVDPSTNEMAIAEKFGWKYYLPEAKQDPEVDVKLADIRKEYKDLKPEDISCIDPCMGSGHILVAMFDVLMDIYTSVGYAEREAAFEIVEHNIHGLDIDKRAYQLAYFAIMMKGRQYNRRFFKGKESVSPRPKIYAFTECNDLNRDQVKHFGGELDGLERNDAITQMNSLLDTFKDSREFGSILNVEKYDWELLRRFIAKTDNEGQMTFETVGLDQTQRIIGEIIDIGRVIETKYDVVITNPPYMGSSGMDSRLIQFLKKNYPNSRSDLFAVFIEACREFVKPNGYQAMITQHSWMFINSYENLRNELIKTQFINLVHLGIKAFEEIGNDVVQTCAFVIKNKEINDYYSSFVRLVDCKNYKMKEIEFLSGNSRFRSKCSDFEGIPGKPIAYWVSKNFVQNFKTNSYIENFGSFTGSQNITGNNEKYLRLFWEVNGQEIGARWRFYAKGGDYRQYYGNLSFVIDWSENAKRFYSTNKTSNLLGEEFWYKEGITYSAITSRGTGFRYLPKGCIFDKGGPSININSNLYEILALLNSNVAKYYFWVFNPSINLQVKDVKSFPIILTGEKNIVNMSKSNLDYCKIDWDSFETSWEFAHHPLVKQEKLIKKAFSYWETECRNRLECLKKNEEYLNDAFICIYGLNDEITSDVEDRDVTVREADLSRDIRSLISYAVGCMFGRYSLDEDGIVFAGGVWNDKSYTTFIPDEDNIIPITDEEYFEDDIVGLFCGWLKKAYGVDTLEENLDFIAKALGNKGDSSREVIRNYFMDEFFKDHCNTYSVTGSGKRPIYWLFDSGKQNGFKALIYMHRYDQDTVGRVRTDYLHKAQKAIEQAKQSAQYTLENSTNPKDKKKATDKISKYTKQLAEIQIYDEAIAHIANQRIALDLDDGVKTNYAKFQGVEVSKEGMKAIKVDLLSSIN